jgi:hypothetical protein
LATGIERLSEETCQHCAHFADDPAVIEAEIPGLTSFGSAYSSARGHAGICRQFDHFMDPVMARDCPSFEARNPISDSVLAGRSKTHPRFREKE